MNFDILKQYLNEPTLYESGNAIMWIDPYISKQLLACHIDSSNDLASRNELKIKKTINWIIEKYGKNTGKILDLGCGPGLYTDKLQKLGFNVVGIDFSETAIEYAKSKNNKVDYHCLNYLDIKYENEFDIVIMIYMDFCVLRPTDRERLLKNTLKALKKNGIFFVDILSNRNIGKMITQNSWEYCEKGFWSDKPYLVLNNGIMYENDQVLLQQNIVFQDNTETKNYLFWNTYYKHEDMKNVFIGKGFTDIEYPETILSNDKDDPDNAVDFYCIRKE